MKKAATKTLTSLLKVSNTILTKNSTSRSDAPPLPTPARTAEGGGTDLWCCETSYIDNIYIYKVVLCIMSKSYLNLVFSFKNELYPVLLQSAKYSQVGPALWQT